MKEKTRHKIKNIVQLYIELYPKEYEQFLKAVRVKQQNQANVFGATKNDSVLERVLYEVPEVLFNMLVVKLEPEEQEELEAIKGAEWFAKTFKQFKIPEKI